MMSLALLAREQSSVLMDLPGSAISDDLRNPSATTTKRGLTVWQEAQTAKIDSHPVQRGLLGLGEDIPIAKRRRSLPRESHQASDDLLILYEKRIAARWPNRTKQQYRWVLRNMLALACNLAGQSVSILEVLRDEQLLGQIFATATTADGKRPVSAWHMAQRRSILRSFVEIMEPELRCEGIVDAGDALIRALRSVAEPVGTGYRLPVGATRGRGGPTPSQEEIAAIQHELSSKPSWRGCCNEAIFSLMVRRGLRIGSLLTLDGASAHRLRDGRMHCFLRAKSKREPYELIVPNDLTELLSRYVEQFNSWAKASGLPDRIGFGVSGLFWRNDLGRPLTYPAWTNELKQACIAASVPVYTSHAFRRAFATNATAVAPRPTVATVGNWASKRLMDDSYCQRSLSRIEQSVARLPSRPALPIPAETESLVSDVVGTRL